MANDDDSIRSLMAEAKAVNDRLDRISRIKPGSCRNYVGKVYNGGSLPTSSDRYVLTRPVSIFGNETEGATATVSVNSSVSVPVLIIGNTPAVDDIIVADLIEGRWVAQKRGGGGSGPITVPNPNCFCGTIPVSGYFVTVEFGNDPFGVPTNAAYYGNAYRPCEMAYYAAGSPPPYMPLSAFPGPGIYSTTSWLDDYGSIDYYRLSCFFTGWALGFGQYNGGTWQSPGQLFNWSMGGPNPQNFCSPFLLAVGQTQPGIQFYGKFIVSGP